ncbi:uncharacterized protein LOC116120327 [Pistacia vera]|uniref:uncharacterized protein LOC116120327 n=1 Tax=Pistacia vera TaxID=55513 RepID=UPI00126391BF|nr:uncharacterized protein LOC116120327 [Pistacia vera]
MDKNGRSSHDCSSEWKETWWEKGDWTGYKELGVEKSGRNAEGDSWWETLQKQFSKDREKAQKQAKTGTEYAGWFEKWWEKNDAEGWTEKRAHEYGRLNEQSWWEKWGEHYGGRGSVLKWLSAVLIFLDDNMQHAACAGKGTQLQAYPLLNNVQFRRSMNPGCCMMGQIHHYIHYKTTNEAETMQK